MRNLKLLILIIISSSACMSSNAQTDSTLNGELRRLLINLKKADCPAPFLFDLAAHFTNDSFYTIRSYDTSNARNWYNLYFEFNAMSYVNGFIPNDTTIEKNANEIINQYIINSSSSVTSGKLPLGLMDFSYNSIRADAWDSSNFGKWYIWDDDTIIDNENRTTEPFEYNLETPSMGTCKEIFAFSPLSEVWGYRKVTFTIDPGNFFFYNNPLYSTNVFSHPSPHEFKIDFDDGFGPRQIDPFNYSEITITYPSEGVYYPKAMVLMDNIIIKHSMSTLTITSDDIEKLPDINIEMPHLNVGIYRGCSSDEKLKPIIYLEGIDILENRRIPDIYSDMIVNSRKPELLPMLYNYDYDFVVVDWKKSTIDMKINASAIVSLIDKLKTMTDTSHQFVVIGESMGGVIARFALTKMETEDYFNTGSLADKNKFKRWRSHNTRLFISLDAPHQGAVIPLAMQHVTDWIYKVPRPLIRTVAFLSTAFVQSQYYKNVMNQTGVKQLLMFHRDTRNNNAEYTAHSKRNEFMDDLIALNPATNGWPEHCKLMAMSNGLMDGNGQVAYNDDTLAPNDLLINVKNLFLGVKIFKVIPIPVFAMSQSKLRISPNGSGNIVELGFSYNLLTTVVSVSKFPYGMLWTMRGCLSNLLRKKNSPCNVLGLGIPFTVDINNAKPLEISPGGFQTFIQRLMDKHKGKKDNKKWLSSSIINYNSKTGEITIKNSMGARFLITGNYNFNSTSDVQHFCFVPLQSALDYKGYDAQGNELPQNYNIAANSASSNMLRTPFDVILGWNTKNTYPLTGYYKPNYIGALPHNGSHLFFRNDKMFEYDMFALNNLGIVNREIGDELLYLDNMNINREGIYQVKNKIQAGFNESPNYIYPNKIPSLSSRIESLNSDTGKFIIDSFSTAGQVEFIAGEDIVLKQGFEAKYNSKFYAHIQNMVVCEYTLEELQTILLSGPNLPTEIPIKINNEEFTIFPNPSSNAFQVKSKHLSKISMGVLTDTNGKLIQSINNDKDHVIFDIVNLTAGVYICTVHCNGIAYRFKIIKQ